MFHKHCCTRSIQDENREDNQELTARVQVRNTDNIKILHLLNEYLLSIYYVLDTIPGPIYSAIYWTDKVSARTEFVF